MPQTGYWPQQYYTTSATTTNYIPVYQPIIQTGYTTGSTHSTDIWQQWVNTSNSTIIQQPYRPYQSTDQVWIQWNQTITPRYIAPTPLTAEQMQAQREANERYEMERQERRREQQAARTKARLLLGEFLNDEQKAELERLGRFHVTGSKGRRYCIRAEGQSGNVDLLKPDGSVQARLCCHPRRPPGDGYDLLPEGGAWLMQMIEIRHDEDHFLRTANVHRGSLPALV